MFHLTAFTESQDSATLVNVAGLADPMMRVQGDDIIVPRGLNQLVAVYALGISLTRAMLVSPSLRGRWNYEISPIDRGADEPASPQLLVELFGSPLILAEDEALNAQAAEDGAAGTRATILVWLADGPFAPVEGEISTLRVTNATTLVANAWTNGALTFDQSLPAGRYAIVGARFQSAGLQAFRFVFPGGTWRPGGMGVDAASDILAPTQRRGGWGVWGEFEHNTPPTVDFLSNSADTSQVGELDLIKVG